MQKKSNTLMCSFTVRLSILVKSQFLSYMGSDRSALKTTAAIRAGKLKLILHAIRAESAFV
jgi:hypothetical protein